MYEILILRMELRKINLLGLILKQNQGFSRLRSGLEQALK